MAIKDEWLGIRGLLPDDPKVIGMADFLSRHEPLSKIVTVTRRNALRSVTDFEQELWVGLVLLGLVRVWRVVNSRGIPDGDDFLLLHTSLKTIDRIAKIDGFSLAMGSAEWAMPDEVDGISAVRFPNFTEYNTPAEIRDDKEKSKRERARERQKRHRAKHRGVTPRNADVTPCHAPIVEQSRVDNSATETTATPIKGWVRGCKGEGESLEISPPENGERQNIPVPPGFHSTIDEIISQFGFFDSEKLLDQIGFLAVLAFADASGFSWPPDRYGNPRSIWNFLNAAKGKENPAGYLKRALQQELGKDGWKAFCAQFPCEAHCQAMLRDRGEKS